jgi:hypothetical protein
MSPLAADLAFAASFTDAGIPARHALRIVHAARHSAGELEALLAVTDDQPERDRLVLEARSIMRARVTAVLRSMPKRVRN